MENTNLTMEDDSRSIITGDFRIFGGKCPLNLATCPSSHHHQRALYSIYQVFIKPVLLIESETISAGSPAAGSTPVVFSPA